MLWSWLLLTFIFSTSNSEEEGVIPNIHENVVFSIPIQESKCSKSESVSVIWNFILCHINPRDMIPAYMYDWALWTAPLFKYGLNHVFPPSSTLPQSITDPSWHTLDHTNHFCTLPYILSCLEHIIRSYWTQNQIYQNLDTGAGQKYPILYHFIVLARLNAIHRVILVYSSGSVINSRLTVITPDRK